MRSGNITGSKNLPFPDCVNQDTATFKTDDELAKLFQSKDLNTSLATIHSCGSGVTACVIDMAFRFMGGENSVIYDGSWTEYG